MAAQGRGQGKVRATDPDRFWQIVGLYAVAVFLVVVGFM